MATNEKSLYKKSFFKLIKGAILSSEKNTTLDKYLVYEGDENPKLSCLKDMGVTVVRRELPIRSEIKHCVKKNFRNCSKEKINKIINARTGAYLRTEIPNIVEELNMDDEYVLYTDCDVIFLGDPELESCSPRYLAAWGRKEGGYTRFHIGGWMHYNSGVMVMNIDNLNKEIDKFRDFALNDGYNMSRPKWDWWQKNLLLSDQIAYNLYFRGKIDDIGHKYNWSPSFGINRDAKIVHFYGPKWTEWDDYKKGELRPELAEMIDDNLESYRHYVEIAEKIADV